MHNFTVRTLSVIGLAVVMVLQAQAAPQEAADGEQNTRHCLPMSRINRIETVDDQTMIFHMHGDEKYINHLPYKCAGLRHNSFLHETSLNSYCDLDIISVIDVSLGMRLGSCPLGPFEPYTEGTGASESKQERE